MIVGFLMDSTDRKILEALQEDARVSRAALGRAVGISAPAVHERIKKLERGGVIRGYRAILDPGETGNGLTAFVLVSTTDARLEDRFIGEMVALAEVQECHHVTGEYSLLLKVRASSIESLQGLLMEKIGEASVVTRTNTMVALSTVKEETRLRVDGGGEWGNWVLGLGKVSGGEEGERRSSADG